MRCERSEAQCRIWGIAEILFPFAFQILSAVGAHLIISYLRQKTR